MDESTMTAGVGIPAAEGSEVRERSAGQSPAGDEQVRAQLARIRAMDPEMRDLGDILSSDAGPRFRQYVSMGLDFVDAYTLAARERLEELRDRRTADRIRAKAAGKGHLSATNTRGQGSVSVPAGEMAVIRALLPDATDEEIRRYYNQDRKRFGR